MKFKILWIMFVILATFLLSSCGSSLNPLGGKEIPELFPISQGGKMGYINRKGEVVIQPQFAPTWILSGGYFSEGLAAACVDTKCGYIDETGKFIINPQFELALRFSEGLAAVVSGDKLGYIDRNGKFVVNPQFVSGGGRPMNYSFSTFSESLARVKIGEKFGFIDKTGKIIINPQFEDAMPFFDGLAAAKIGDKWGFIDKDGKIVINPQYEDAQPFINGLAAVRIGKQYGYVDKTGKIAINPQFDEASPFSDEGLAAVSLNRTAGFIDKEGKYIVNPQFGVGGIYSNLEMLFLNTSDLGRLSLSEGLAPVRLGDKEGTVGYADKTGKILINPQFQTASPFYGGLALVILVTTLDSGRSATMAYIDKDGKYIWRETRETPKASNTAVNAAQTAANTMANSANAAPKTSSNSNKTGRLATDSNLRSEPNKNAASLGIQFKGAKIQILDERSYTVDGQLSTWYQVRVTEYGCSVNANLGCGKNNQNDADEGWVNAKGVLLD